MLAVVELLGHQYIVKAGDIIETDNQNKEVGETFSVAPYMLSEEDGTNARIGTPTVEGAKVTLKVIEDFRGDKVRVFKMKSKKHYARTFGFRADKTRLEVVEIG